MKSLPSFQFSSLWDRGEGKHGGNVNRQAKREGGEEGGKKRYRKEKGMKKQTKQNRQREGQT
jgi:hypothetical protein